MISVALSEATPVLVNLAESMGTLLVEALIELLPHLIDLLDAILPLIPPIVQLAEKVLPPLIDILGMVIPPLVSLASAILSVTIPAIEAIIKAIGLVYRIRSGDIAKGPSNACQDHFQMVHGPSLVRYGIWLRTPVNGCWRPVRISLGSLERYC